MKTKKFGIFHPKNGELNLCCKPDTHEYEFITFVESENLSKVMYSAQNDFNPDYCKLGKRSTSVGDVVTNGKSVFMVANFGYKRILKKSELYTKIMEIDEAIIEILSRNKLTEDQVNDLIENSY